MTDYPIRPARAEELPDLAAIEHDAAQLFREVGYDFCAEGPVRDDAEVGRAFNDGAVIVAADASDRPCGFAMVWRLDGRAHLLELAILGACRGAGLGRRLIAAAEDWSRGDGFDEITLTTYRDVPWNRPYYERLGYETFEPEAWRTGLQEVQREEAESGFAVKPRVAMRKQLGTRA